MEKFYKVIKENFLWEVGAILTSSGGYRPIDSVWNKNENVDEYISATIVESQPEYFQRVYKVNLLKSVIYKTKEEAVKLLSKEYQD